eukprot:g43020.t1
MVNYLGFKQHFTGHVREADGLGKGCQSLESKDVVEASLFQLPKFRRLVLNYIVPENPHENCRSHTEQRNLAFMQELRCLFALMVASMRKYVDPSNAVDLLKDAFRSNEAQQ